MRSLILLTAFPLLAALPASGQESCGERIDQLSAQIGTPTELPQAGEGSTLSDTLAESGGVLEPPPEGRTPVIEPPPTAPDAMPTAPPVDDSANAERPGSDLSSRAATHVRVSSLLTGAREALEQGDEEACMERVDEAVALLEDEVD